MMSSNPIVDPRWELDRRQSDDRRDVPERRRESDRRGAGVITRATQDTVRSYVFRSFSDRRAGNDRRSHAGNDRRALGERQFYSDLRQDDGTVDLSPEEVLALLHQPEE